MGSIVNLARHLALGLLAGGLSSAGAAEYQVIDLGTLGGDHSAAFGVNDLGWVVGSAQDADGRLQAFVWRDGAMAGLGFLPGGTSSVATAINNHGEIAGRADASPTNFHAFRHAGGALVDLGTLGGVNSQARAINDAGAIAGSSQLATNSPNATVNESFLWITSRFAHVHSFPDYNSCDAFGINQDGLICGNTFVYSPYDRWWGFVWADDNGNFLHDFGEMRLLGSLGVKDSVGEMSAALDVNDVGQAVGWTCVTNRYYPRHAFLVTSAGGIWKRPNPASNIDPTNTLMRDLGVLGGPTNNSWARGVNNRSWVVGNADMPSGTNQAFLWRDGSMRNLNDLIDPAADWVLTNATAINLHGEIVGSGLHAGQSRAFLLRREGRITGFDPLYVTNAVWVWTNGQGAVVTQADVQVVGQSLQWSGSWGTNVAAPGGYTVECSDSMRDPAWTPCDPAEQWPLALNAWTNDGFGAASARFFRVRARW